MNPNDPIPVDPVPEPAADALASAEQVAEPAPPVVITCWRCGLATPDAVHCDHCHAVLKKEDAVRKKKDERRRNPKVFTLILAYLAMLCTSIVYSVILHGSEYVTEKQAEQGLMIIEAIDLVLTLSLFLFLGRRIMRIPSMRTRILTWLIAPGVSVGVFFLSHWYVEMLRRRFSLDWMYTSSHMELDWYHVLSIAVYPAFVEELFFRYFAYGTLRLVTNVHAAVFLSALMFALAHLYNPLGLPFLLLMGIMLGYARAYSGGLLLPMLMHFGHNFAVLYLESMK